MARGRGREGRRVKWRRRWRDMVERGEAGKGRRAETINITKILPEYELAITVIHNSLIYSDSISLHVCETEREKKRKRETWRVSGGG